MTNCKNDITILFTKRSIYFCIYLYSNDAAKYTSSCVYSRGTGPYANRDILYDT